MAKQVIIYSTKTCPFCKMTKEFFKDNNVEYEERDVSDDAALQQEVIDKSGGFAVPVIDIDGEIVIGFQKDKLAQLLGVV